jgi:hypothetical protein
MAELKSYSVWDAGVRWFHWINVYCSVSSGPSSAGHTRDGARFCPADAATSARYAAMLQNCAPGVDPATLVP